MRRLPLNLWWRDLLLVGVGTVDGLQWLLGVCGSIQLFFFLFDEGALTRPMTFVSAINAAVGYFLPSAGVFPLTLTGVASVAPPSSVVLRPGVAGFVTRDRVHGLRGLRLFSLMWLRPVAIARSLLIHLFDSPALSFV